MANSTIKDETPEQRMARLDREAMRNYRYNSSPRSYSANIERFKDNVSAGDRAAKLAGPQA